HLTLLPTCSVFACSHSVSHAHPYPPSFPTRRSSDLELTVLLQRLQDVLEVHQADATGQAGLAIPRRQAVTYGLELRIGRGALARSEEHTSELQSRENLVCRLLLEKKK